MGISLSKGQKLDLTKGNANLSHLMIGLGWSAGDFDLDTAAFMLGANGKVSSDEDFIFYGNLKHASGAVEHKGDNLTGGSGGDAEQIKVDLSRMPQNVERVAFTATIYDADTRKQNFGQVKNAYIRVVDEDHQQELLRYDLGEAFSVETAVVVGEIYRYKGEWKFNAIGSGYQGGLAALCGSFGVDVGEGQGSAAPAPAAASTPKPAPAPTPDPAAPAPAQTPSQEDRVLKIGTKPVNLKKGQKISLEKNNGTTLKRAMVGLGWDPAENKGGGFFSMFTGNIDLDAMAILCTNGKLKEKKDIVCFTNLEHPSGFVKHMGDNLTGEGEGDDEEIFVDLGKLPSRYDRIVFAVNIFHFFKTKQHFGMIKNAFIRICDDETHKELCRYNLSENYNGKKAVIFGELYRENGKWLFKPVGEGTMDDSIEEIAARYK